MTRGLPRQLPGGAGKIIFPRFTWKLRVVPLLLADSRNFHRICFLWILPLCTLDKPTGVYQQLVFRTVCRICRRSSFDLVPNSPGFGKF